MWEYDPPHLSVGYLHVLVQWLNIGGDPLAMFVKSLAESVALKEEGENVRK